jgi:ferric-dicitrate binding protein FerR (iron transport regulator)
VNAYEDEEALTATLEEGAVRVTAVNGQQTVLAPAQQARLQNNKLLVQKNINVTAITAWKNGLFHFESADLQTILKQLARWYDIEVVYEGKISNEKFFSIMKRSSTLNSVLKALQANGVQFRIEGKKLTVQSSG